jgi:hypothetical protein
MDLEENIACSPDISCSTHQTFMEIKLLLGCLYIFFDLLIFEYFHHIGILEAV